MKSCILCFHDVSCAQEFERKVSFLTQVGAVGVLSAPAVEKQAKVPKFIITFDDGCNGVYHRAAPVLADAKVPAMLFVVTQMIGNTTPFWWQEVGERWRAGARSARMGSCIDASSAVRYLKRVPDFVRIGVIDELRASSEDLVVEYPHLTASQVRELEGIGIEIGAHSRTHPCLDRCSSEKIIDEVRGSRDDLATVLGHAPRSFAYPNGNHDQRVIDAVRSAGFEYGFLFDHRLQDVPIRDPLSISRVRVDAGMSMAKFVGVVSGVLPWLHHVRGLP